MTTSFSASVSLAPNIFFGCFGLLDDVYRSIPIHPRRKEGNLRIGELCSEERRKTTVSKILIGSSYDAMPKPEVAELWAKRTSPDFAFNIFSRSFRSEIRENA